LRAAARLRLRLRIREENRVFALCGSRPGGAALVASPERR
jgi:hypothetical protein